MGLRDLRATEADASSWMYRWSLESLGCGRTVKVPGREVALGMHTGCLAKGRAGAGEQSKV